MSISQLMSMWNSDGEGSLRTSFGPGRFSARNDLIKRHNFKGEAVFIASRRWHEAKAESNAADRRLQDALAEAEKAKAAEQDALKRLAYGRPLPATKSKYVTGQGPSVAFGEDSAPKHGKFKVALMERMAAHQREREAEQRSALRRSMRIEAKASKLPPRPSTERPAGGGTRAAWAAKMQAKSAKSPPPTAATVSFTLETKAPRRGGAKRDELSA